MSQGSEKRIRDTVLPIRLSRPEREAVEGKAARAGLATGSYARQVLLDAPAPRQVRRPMVERQELVRLLGELGKVGGNLNQLAKAANQERPVYEDEVLAVLASLKLVREAILVALGREP
jgi:hypothetical protein